MNDKMRKNIDDMINNRTMFVCKSGKKVYMTHRGKENDETYTKVNVVYFSDGLYRTMDGRCPFMFSGNDIFHLFKKIEPINKVTIKIVGFWRFELVGTKIISTEYSSKKSCIKGAERFCKKFDIEYKIV